MTAQEQRDLSILKKFDDKLTKFILVLEGVQEMLESNRSLVGEGLEGADPVDYAIAISAVSLASMRFSTDVRQIVTEVGAQ